MAGSTQYALVSSFYGPGTVAAWYLTALGSIVSHSLHPRKGSTDSITADTIVVLAFPTIAAADLIIQLRSFVSEAEILSETVRKQKAAASGAALVVIETFLGIAVILFLLAAGFKCVVRGCLLAAIGLLL